MFGRLRRVPSVVGVCLAVCVAGCIEEPEKIGDPGCDAELCHQFRLYVGNQSLHVDPVAIDVTIDDVHVITGEFELGDQRNWYRFDFELAEGEHSFEAEAPDEDATLSRTLTMKREQWGLLEFGQITDPGGGTPMTRSFGLTLTDSEPIFY
jgi:hypothetical protein